MRVGGVTALRLIFGSGCGVELVPLSLNKNAPVKAKNKRVRKKEKWARKDQKLP